MSGSPKAKDPQVKPFPKGFKEQYKRKVFEKKILKRIFIPTDKEFLQGFYEIKSENYELKEKYRDKKKSLTKKDFQRLSKLRKSVKKNASFIDWFKVGFFTVILVAGLLLSLLFIPAWIETQVTEALEEAFGAEVDLRGLEVNLFEGRIGFESLAVANKNNLSSNLFEMDRGEVSINTRELLSNRFHVESIQAQGIRWDTPRGSTASSGAGASTQINRKEVLVQFDPSNAFIESEVYGPEIPEMEMLLVSDQSESDPFSGFFTDLLGPQSSAELIPKEIIDLDLEALLRAQTDQLQTPDVLESSLVFLEGLKTSWEDKASQTQSDIRAFSISAQNLASRDLSAISNVAQAQELLTEVSDVTSQYGALKISLDTSLNEARSDWDQVIETQQAVTEALDQDEDHLNSLISLPLTGENSLASTLILGPLQDSLGSYGSIAYTALEFIQNLSAGNSDEQPEFREGIDIQVPIPEKPDFLIRDAGFSIGLEGNDGFHSLDLQNISSDSSLISDPLLIAYRGQIGEPVIDFAIQENKEEQNYELKAAYSGQRFNQQGGLEVLGVQSIHGTLSFMGSLELGPESTLFDLQLRIQDMVTEYGPSSEIVNLVKQIMESNDFFTLDLSISDQSGNRSITVSSNAEDIIQETIQAWLNEKIQESRDLLIQGFRSTLQDSLGENSALVEEVNELLAALENDQINLDSAKNLLDQKKRAIENRIKELATQNLIPENIEVPDIQLPGF